MTAGKPAKFKTVEELQNAIDKYFNENKESPTITGLALELGFASRQSFYDYEKNKKYSYTVKRARLKIENFYESHLIGQYTSGPIFALKNFGWSDKQDVDITTGGDKLPTTININGISANRYTRKTNTNISDET